MDEQKKVVIIEENPKLSQTLSDIFWGFGYLAVRATTGLEGVEKVCEERPDIITLNPAITDINGCHVYRLLKDDPKFADIPIFVIIESERDRFRLWGANPQIEQNVVKFTTEEELKESIGHMIDKLEKEIAGGRFQAQSGEFKAILERLTETYQGIKDLTSERAREALDELLGKIITMLNSEAGSVMLLEQETQELVIKVAKGLSAEIIDKTRVKVGSGISGWVARRGAPLLVRNIEDNGRFCKENDKKYYTNSLISAPIMVRENVVGVINVNNKSSREAFNEQDLSLLTALTSELSIAIEALHLKAELKETNAELEKLKKSKDILASVTRSLDDELYELTISQEVSNIIYSRLDYKEIVKAILEIIEHTVDCHICGLLYVDEERKAEAMVEIKYAVTQEEVDKFKSKMIETFNDLSGSLLLPEAVSVNLANETNIVESRAEARDILGSYEANPLRAGEKPIGILAIANSFPNAFTGDDLRVVSIISHHSSVAINNTLLHKKIKELSVTDGLTGRYVYRYFNEALDREIQRAGRYRQKFSLIMLDVDGFKKINDDFGHLQGDEVLREIGRILRKVCRQVDIISRYGGEEFAIILPETDMDGAFVLAERIRMVVKNYAFGAENSPVSLTVSLGAATYPDSADAREELLGEADKALYKAKADGKNRVCRAYKETLR